MGYWSAGVRDYYGMKAITTPEDMQGMTIRTQTSRCGIRILTGLGTQPVNIGWGVLYDATLRIKRLIVQKMTIRILC